MTSTSNVWETRFQEEIKRAENARLGGNEGMARVCARRAAGIVIGEYFQRLGLPDLDPSAYTRLRQLHGLPGVGERIRAVAGHFLLRITPENVLPIEVDLIAEAYWLADQLTGDNMENIPNSDLVFIHNIVDEIAQIQLDSIISRTILNNDRLKVVLFGFAPGQELSEHTASSPAVLHILSGEAHLTLGGEEKHAAPGSWAYMPANLPHSVYAQTNLSMLLVLLKNE